MEPVKITENVYWVGGIDWDLRDFHGYKTQRGTTYNAYLIIDEKVTLIDTVKHYLFDEMLARISAVIDPTKIDYVISNHVEMDHSGSLPKIMEIASNATLFASPKGVDGLKLHYNHEKWKMESVSPGTTLNLGKRNLEFILTPMVHWPDNMITYLPEEKILFSNDSFGQHLASPERFDGQLPRDIVLYEAKKYYANIVMPYGGQVKREFNNIKEQDYDIEIIAPSHGIIWREYINEILTNYQKWSGNETEKSALVVYDTMWNSTAKMAYALAEQFEALGIKAHLKNLKATHISDIIPFVLDTEYICVGSPTLNNNMMPTVASFLTYLKGLSPGKRKAFAFGSYGWSGQSIGQVADMLSAAKFEVLAQINFKFIPEEQDLNEIKKQLADSLK